jgi:NAD(P)-dependent dehydrogenase (short-subunit alcohol dehydrogenase family)
MEDDVWGLRGKGAIVTGGGAAGDGIGNGRAACILLARAGAGVLVVDRDIALAERTVAMIHAEGGTAEAASYDVTDNAACAAMVAHAERSFGRLDVLDNNVGIAEVGGVVEISEADWDRIFAVNVKGAFLAMKEAIPVMQRHGGGAIVNISSIAAIRWTGVPYATYYATKAALSHLTRTTAVEYAARGIRVNAVLPGLMKTPMVEKSAGLAQTYSGGDVEEMWRVRDAQVPMGHMGDAWDVAHAALFLASDEAKYITGIELLVDGGITLKYA